MKEYKPVTERLTDALAKESKKFAQKKSEGTDALQKLEVMVVQDKSTYSFPLKDTIGRTFREQIQFNSEVAL